MKTPLAVYHDRNLADVHKMGLLRSLFFVALLGPIYPIYAMLWTFLRLTWYTVCWARRAAIGTCVRILCACFGIMLTLLRAVHADYVPNPAPAPASPHPSVDSRTDCEDGMCTICLPRLCSMQLHGWQTNLVYRCVCVRERERTLTPRQSAVSNTCSL